MAERDIAAAWDALAACLQTAASADFKPAGALAKCGAFSPDEATSLIPSTA
jgi:hypothetical protein